MLDYPIKSNDISLTSSSAWLTVLLAVNRFVLILIQTVPLIAVVCNVFKSLKRFPMLTMPIIFFWSYGLFVVVECITFYCECISYIVVGLLLNFNDVIPYISFVLLISVYGYNCFHRVDVVFFSFINNLCEATQRRISERMENQKWLSASDNNEEQNVEKIENIAFILSKSSETSQMNKESFLVSQDGRLRLKASSLCSFLHISDSKTRYYLSREFFDSINKILHGFSPGNPFMLYFNSFRDFGLVSLFLYFVIIVVFALGKAHNVPTRVQTLVALGGGFLPFIFKKVFSRIGSHDVSGLKI